MPDSPAPSSIARHFGLDWLRIGAFVLLILFHISLYFGPTPWLMKSPQQAAWVAWPMAAIVPWRLTLLFAVSGYATAAMIERSAGLGGFLRDRSSRLLVPMAFAMLVIVPPQDWARLDRQGIEESYPTFYLQDFLSFHTRAGVFLPNWEHLWFLPTLLAFTVMLVAAMALAPNWTARAAAGVEWLAQGHRLLVVPLLALMALLFLLGKTHLFVLAVYIDYFPAFLFGFAYAHFPAIRQAIARLFPLALIISLAALAVIWEAALLPSAIYAGPQRLAEMAAEYVMSWAMMPVLFYLADRFLNFDSRLRAPLAAAVFPAYLVHQTVIVLTGWYLAQRGIVGVPAFLIIFTAVVAGCYATWRLAGAFPLAGELLGMPHKCGRGPLLPAKRPAHEG